MIIQYVFESNGEHEPPSEHTPVLSQAKGRPLSRGEDRPSTGWRMNH
ncbi:MAG: hypothetical protein WD035_02800 [Balneolaceae bacterium]